MKTNHKGWGKQIGMTGWFGTLLAGVMLAAQGGLADSITWTGGSGLFSDGGNWSGGMTPGSSDTAIFNTSDATYTVTLDSPVTNAGVVFAPTNGVVTLDIGSGNSYYIANSVIFHGTGSGNAGIAISSGILCDNSTFLIGDQSYDRGAWVSLQNSGTALIGGGWDDIVSGNGASDCQLLVDNGAAAISSRAFYAGKWGSSASNNLIRVSGTGSIINALSYDGNGAAICSGLQGTDNRILLENGARAVATNGGQVIVGFQAGADRNSIEVLSGSVVTNFQDSAVGRQGAYCVGVVSNASWFTGSFYVGDQSASNQLTVIDGSQLGALAHFIIGANAGASGNNALVSGSGTRVGAGWFDITVGANGSNNRMVVSNGATATAGRGVFVGAHNDFTAVGSDNALVVDGAGSVLSASSSRSVVGDAGTNNMLRLENGATYVGANDLNLGYTASALSNAMIVGAGCVVSNQNNAVFVGRTGCANTLTVSNATFNSGVMFVGYDTGADRNSVDVRSGSIVTSVYNTIFGYGGSSCVGLVSNASWFMDSFLLGAANSASNQLAILDGGKLEARGTFQVGEGVGSTCNTILVSGSGTRVSALNYDVTVGQNGSNNRMVVSNGATATAGRGLFVGASIGGGSGSDNTLVVDGAGTVLSTTYDRSIVGDAGTNNMWRLEHGATYIGSNNLYIGYNASALSNAMVVGSGATVSNSCAIFVGLNGNANSLTVSNANVITMDSLLLGLNSSISNQLAVMAGGQLGAQGHFMIGPDAGTSGNNVLVSGSGSRVDARYYDVSVGRNGNNNRMVVSNGATATAGRGVFVGASADGLVSGSGNTLVVDGAGSVLSAASGRSVVGDIGSNNTWRLEHGATYVGSNELLIGYSASGLSNAMVVGSGSTVSNNGVVFVGFYGGASLTVSNATFIARGLTWIGCAGVGSRLTVQDGGAYRVNGADAFIGDNASSTGNVLLVTGNGSSFSTSDYHLRVGSAGPYNSLVVSNGGAVTVAGTLYVGTFLGSSNNTVSVVNGGVLSAASWEAGHESEPGNIITNAGGIYQFGAATPGITLNGGNKMYISSGTIAFKNVNGFDVKGNWAGTDLTKLTWAGNNALRFDHSTNNAAGQGYTFGTGLGATNYTRLELVNGALYQGGDVTIGANGSLMGSNGMATIQGALINNGGAITVVDGTLSVAGDCTLADGATINMASNSVAPSLAVGGTLTLPANGTFSYNGTLARDTQLTLMTANQITGNTLGWITTPATHRLRVQNGALVLMPRVSGFIIEFF